MSNEADFSEPRRITFTGYGGITLAGESWGPEDGPLAVFLHGGGQTRHSWKESGAALAKAGMRAVLLDARGHGESDWAPDGNYRREAMTADLLGILAELGRPAIVVGASMGGLTALLATARPGSERIAGLVLVDVVPRPEHKGVERVLNFLGANPEGFASLDEAADAVAAYLPHRPRPRTTEGLRRNLRLCEDGRWYWHWDPAMMSGGGEDVERHTELLEQAARQLSIPVLLVRGRLSDVVSEQGVAEFRNLVPHMEYVEIGGAAHTAASDVNDEFSDAVVDFVRAHLETR
ncbi:alpha/beta fold hydrolase [Nocardia pseudobrasiliensis]|uniref:Pimeloyl-ACP methyl ester carboxylesterase n=1 Tax=Nocardia pseudobrasiliensis TaxID=45979 RepID=A0A370I9F8_9NOCA|nr:alpha/beta hydrolase [Nocardia pseudobrasiliensis]RDI67362.1 pimeloyl-ACP methyl ester carboxylesterase [Nocardia pseudobrasiliensis]